MTDNTQDDRIIIYPPMPYSTVCINARASLEEIRTLKHKFDVAYSLAITSNNQEDIEKAQKKCAGFIEKHLTKEKLFAQLDSLHVLSQDRFDTQEYYLRALTKKPSINNGLQKVEKNT